MSLFEDLKSCALSRGADYFGIADLAPAHAFILAQGGEQIARYPGRSRSASHFSTRWWTSCPTGRISPRQCCTGTTVTMW